MLFRLVLWMGAVYLVTNKANHWIALLPATFMSSVSLAYILQAPEGFRLPAMFSNIAGVVFAIGLFIYFIVKKKNIKVNEDIA